MDKWIDYAPLIIIVLYFFLQFRVFITPAQMSEKFITFEHDLEKKFVLQKTHDIAISEIKLDIQAINEKLDRIYDILIKG